VNKKILYSNHQSCPFSEYHMKNVGITWNWRSSLQISLVYENCSLRIPERPCCKNPWKGNFIICLSFIVKVTLLIFSTLLVNAWPINWKRLKTNHTYPTWDASLWGCLKHFQVYNKQVHFKVIKELLCHLQWSMWWAILMLTNSRIDHASFRESYYDN
jgi:hypothetical protein